jgi:hypothetical protein
MVLGHKARRMLESVFREILLRLMLCDSRMSLWSSGST